MKSKEFRFDAFRMKRVHLPYKPQDLSLIEGLTDNIS